jgi:hypothetical protein
MKTRTMIVALEILRKQEDSMFGMKRDDWRKEIVKRLDVSEKEADLIIRNLQDNLLVSQLAYNTFKTN